MTRRRGEEGVGVVLVVGIVALLVVVSVCCVGVAGLVAGHRHVQGAADLVALAGAEAVRSGGDACREAERVAAANRVDLISCATSGEVVEVSVATVLDLAGSWALTGRARAGPS